MSSRNSRAALKKPDGRLENFMNSSHLAYRCSEFYRNDKVVLSRAGLGVCQAVLPGPSCLSLAGVGQSQAHTKCPSGDLPSRKRPGGSTSQTQTGRPDRPRPPVTAAEEVAVAVGGSWGLQPDCRHTHGIRAQGADTQGATGASEAAPASGWARSCPPTLRTVAEDR